MVLGERAPGGQVSTSEWTKRDIDYMLALEIYEEGLCPGGDHFLAETSKPEHEDAYRGGKKVKCYHCKASAAIQRAESKDEDSEGVYTPIVLDPEIVALNRQPVPPLPPELQAP